MPVLAQCSRTLAGQAAFLKERERRPQEDDGGGEGGPGVPGRHRQTTSRRGEGRKRPERGFPRRSTRYDASGTLFAHRARCPPLVSDAPASAVIGPATAALEALAEEHWHCSRPPQTFIRVRLGLSPGVNRRHWRDVVAAAATRSRSALASAPPLEHGVSSKYEEKTSSNYSCSGAHLGGRASCARSFDGRQGL